MSSIISNFIFIVGLTGKACLIPDCSLGPPTIQAVCRVSTDSGYHEGFISLGHVNTGRYTAHGFCFIINDSSFRIVPFGLDFHTFMPSQNSYYRKGLSTLVYAKDISPLQRQSKDEVYDKHLRILTRTMETGQQWCLSDTFSLYLDLPLLLHVEFGQEETHRVQIPVDSITRFELLRQPGDEWLARIDQARCRVRALMKNKVETINFCDYQEPEWYHEVISDEKKKLYLMQFF